MKTTSLSQSIQQSLSDSKALDIAEMDVSKLTSSFDSIVICTGTSSKHVQSIAKKLVEAMKSENHRPLGVEGEEVGDWILVDLNDVIVHIMQKEQRDLYQLEKLWKVAEESRSERKSSAR